MGFFPLSIFALIFAVQTPAMAHVQYSSDGPKISIDVVELEGTRLPRAMQEQLVTSLKQREWEENSDWVADLETVVISAESEDWPDRANQEYPNFSVSASWKPLRREQGLLHVLVTVHVDEGQQKRLKKIEFRDVGGHLGPPVFDSNKLRKLIPLNDGEIYNRDKYHAGIDAVAATYKERGFIELTTNESLTMDDDNQTVTLVIDITEGKRFRWGNIQVIGLDPNLV